MQVGTLVEYHSRATHSWHIGVVVAQSEGLAPPPEGSVYVWSGKLDEYRQPIVFLFALHQLAAIAHLGVREVDLVEDAIPPGEPARI